MKSIFTFLFLSFCSLLHPTKLYAQLGQCPTCKKAIANCKYKGKHPEPSVKISFSSSEASHPMLLYIDGVRKDSITAYPGGSYSCYLKYGTHTIVATAQDMEDYKESITVNKNTASWHPIKAERAFNGKNASQIKNIGDYYANGTNGRTKCIEEAYLWYMRAAEMGDALAQYLWGSRLLALPNSSNDARTAIDYLRRSAEQGYNESQYEMGNVYYYGEEEPYYHGCGITQNYNEALKWYKMAAAQTHTKAAFYIGNIYYRGYHYKNAKSDYGEAMKWFKEVNNYDVAQDFIGYMYYKGLGVEENLDSARVWFLKAANQGNSDAQKNLGDTYYYNYTKEIQGEVRNAREILLKKYKFDNNQKGKDNNTEGKNVKTTKKLSPDYPNALKWYSKAANQDNADAQKCLAEMFLEGKGTNKNSIKAMELYKKAFDNYLDKGEQSDAYNIGKNNLLPLIRAEYIKSPASNKKEYSTHLGRLSFAALFQKRYIEAEQYAREGIAADDSQQWIYTNLAASLLFQGKFSEAEKVYTQWKDKLKMGFLDDFRIFEKRNMLSVEQKSEIEKIKNMLIE